MKKVINRIINARKIKNISQKQIAKSLGISQAAYAKMESGETSLSLERVFQIADFLKVSIGYFLGIESKKESNENDQLKVLVFNALDMFVSNQIFFRSTEFDENNPEHQKKFEEYQNYLMEFKTGIYETLVTVGFCTHEDIKSYREYINPNKKK